MPGPQNLPHMPLDPTVVDHCAASFYTLSYRPAKTIYRVEDHDPSEEGLPRARALTVVVWWYDIARGDGLEPRF